MKKFLVCIVAVSLVMAMGLPAMAETTVDVSGSYYLQGFWNENPDWDDNNDDFPNPFLDPDDKIQNANKDNAFYWQRFRLKTVFNANDRVSVTTRLDAHDETNTAGGVFGQGDTPTGYNDDIDLDRTYLTYKSDIGAFIIGRQQGGVWGLEFGDDEGDYDRIKYALKTGDVIAGGIIQKNVENDGFDEATDDNDADTYYLFGILQQENFEMGLLCAWARIANYTVSALPAANENVANVFGLLPYFKANLGPVTLQGELIHERGHISYDENDEGLRNALGANYFEEMDTLTYNIEAQVNTDPVNAFIGYASQSGEKDLDDEELNTGNRTYGGIGDDFCPLAMLTDDLGGSPLNDNMTNWHGVNLVYAGASAAVTDTITVRGAAGWACANRRDLIRAQELALHQLAKTVEHRQRFIEIDPVYGWEVDLGVDVQLADNLVYSATVAYVDSDDLLNGKKLDTTAAGAPINWNSAINDTKEEGSWGAVHKITASF